MGAISENTDKSVTRVLRVLVVDDHFLIRHIVSEIAARGGVMEVSSARDGKDAVTQILDAHIRCQSYDIIFIDWTMPEMSGLDVVKIIRTRRELDHIVFVMLSAESEPKRIKEAIAAGVYKYLIKPTPAEKIAAALMDVAQDIAVGKVGYKAVRK